MKMFFPHLATAAASASAGLYSAWAFGSFDFHLTVFHLTVWEFGRFDRIKGRRIAAGIE